MELSHRKLYVLLIYVVLTLVVLVAYLPLRYNDFVNYDDNGYVTENPHVKSGLTQALAK